MLISFKNDENLKNMLLEEIIKHRKADEIIQGVYWQDGKGCAVGCSIKSLNDRLHKRYDYSDHSVYEKALGLPEWLARLEDKIFEGLTPRQAKLWPERFTKAIPVGVNLEKVKWQFCAFLMKENIERVLTLDISDDLKKQVVDAIRQVLAVHQTAIKTGEWNESAAWSAGSVAWSVAWSAGSAAESVAWSAGSVARSAVESAAGSAGSAAESVAWSVAWSVARSAAYRRYANELLRLLRKAK